MVKLNCDFCSIPITTIIASCWTYPCADFSVDGPGGINHNSVGPWLACGKCAEIIETGDLNALAERALAGGPGDLPCDVRDAMKATLIEMHSVFMTFRTGPRHPVTDDDANKTEANRALDAYRCHSGKMLPGYQSEHCPNHADLELAVEGAGPLKWFPTCIGCARSALRLPEDADVPLDGVTARGLSGVSPESLVRQEIQGDEAEV